MTVGAGFAVSAKGDELFFPRSQTDFETQEMLNVKVELRRGEAFIIFVQILDSLLLHHKENPIIQTISFSISTFSPLNIIINNNNNFLYGISGKIPLIYSMMYARSLARSKRVVYLLWEKDGTQISLDIRGKILVWKAARSCATGHSDYRRIFLLLYGTGISFLFKKKPRNTIFCYQQMFVPEVSSTIGY